MAQSDGGRRKSGVYFAVFAIVAVALRLLLVLRGHNGDLITVQSIAARPWGSNFYQDFSYEANWGPILYWIFQGLYRLPAGGEIGRFHLYVAMVYALCDVWSAWVLRRVFGLAAAGIFLFMPAEMIVSGFHCNAEPAVIACVMGAMWFLKSEVRDQKSEVRTNWWFYVLIGASLGVKHAFVFFPIWLAMRRGSWRERLGALMVPYATYLLIILPFLIPTPGYWVKNVAMYSGWSGNGVIPRSVVGVMELAGVQSVRVPAAVWLALFVTPLLGVGWLSRRMEKRSLLILYGPALVGLSSAMALQYLALPAYSFSAWADALAWIYNAFSAWLMAGHPLELGLYRLPLKMTVNFDNRGLQFLQWVCLIWVGLKLRAHRRARSEGDTDLSTKDTKVHEG